MISNLKPNFLGLITARTGSKGVPGKNLAEVGGRPLIEWTVRAALDSKHLERVVVSTDGAEIADLCRTLGAGVPFMRPPELSGDEILHTPVVTHAVEWLAEHDGYKADYIVLLQPTSPLRDSADIDTAVELARTSQAEAVMSVNETHNPLMLRTLNSAGALHAYGNLSGEPGASGSRRQTVPPIYFINGAIYIVKTEILLTQGTISPPQPIAYLMPRCRSLQIDDHLDLKLADYLLRGGI